MEDLKVGVIGAAGRGCIAANAHRPGEGSVVVACCDIAGDVLSNCPDWYGSDVFTTTDVSELLNCELNAVILATPDFLHETQAIAVLEAGMALYVEKPMALTTDGCDRILRAAMANGARLFVGHNMRHMPFVLEMKRIIDSGQIGEVKTAWCRHFVGNGGEYYFKDWHAERQYTTGLLLQKGAHDIDILHWLCGGYSRLVNALGALTVYDRCESRQATRPAVRPPILNHDFWPPLQQPDIAPYIDVEDVSMMQMQLSNGVLASYQQCHYTPDYWRNYTIIGTEGRIENFGNGEPGSHVKLWKSRSNYRADADRIYELHEEEGGHGGSDPLIMAEFLRFAREGGVTKTSPVAARESVAAGCAATHSLRNGGIPVKVSPVEPDIAAYFEHHQRGKALAL